MAIDTRLGPSEARREEVAVSVARQRNSSLSRRTGATTTDRAPTEEQPEEREALFAEMQPLVRRLLRQYGDDPELRQDLPGEIFRRFCMALDAYDPGRGVPLRPYLVCNLNSSIYTYVRSQWRRRKREVNLDPELEVTERLAVDNSHQQWINDVMTQEAVKILPEAIGRLSPRQRAVVVGRFFEARSFEEIAESMQICPATARSLLRHGLNNLRRHFARAGWTKG